MMTGGRSRRYPARRTTWISFCSSTSRVSRPTPSWERPFTGITWVEIPACSALFNAPASGRSEMRSSMRPGLSSVWWSRRDWKLDPPPDANTATDTLIHASRGQRWVTKYREDTVLSGPREESGSFASVLPHEERIRSTLPAYCSLGSMASEEPRFVGK